MAHGHMFRSASRKGDLIMAWTVAENTCREGIGLFGPNDVCSKPDVEGGGAGND